MARIHDLIRRLARRTLPLLVAVLVLSGCGEVNDMLNAGAGKEAKPAGEATAADTSGQSAKAKLEAYYTRESRKVEHDPNDPIVSCNLAGKRQFMRRADCALRGGHE